ncbi:hypothetical protein C0W59_21560 [Photobacterium kishitanii]|uniref:hypothetical protein n=1 Tax=Photobacterium kishitanii TaxID=318456 RepID=UPI000D17BD98|nr:hypothetical protein [Photobacterium kishitanii]PSV09997.1 hypothetical protein C0W59_21560 [Photobacterium kishitanii]
MKYIVSLFCSFMLAGAAFADVTITLSPGESYSAKINSAYSVNDLTLDDNFWLCVGFAAQCFVSNIPPPPYDEYNDDINMLSYKLTNSSINYQTL